MSTTSSYSSTNTTQSVFLDPQSANTGLILCILAYVSYGILAIAFSFLKDARKKNKTTDFIITARHSQSLWWSAASWFSCGIGAFTLFGPADFVVDPSIGTGIIGLLVYSIFSGIPLVWVARIGSTVRKNVPQATSVSSYAQWRFGKEVQIFVLFLVLFILTINLLDEYLVIGTIFAQFFGCSPHVPIVTVGIITMVYTGFGGLYVSILTDLYQTVLVLLLVFVSVIWMIYSFCGVSFPSLPDYLGSTAAGWKTIATIGIPFTCGTFFGEAFWQRCWSADSEKSLRYGSLIGGVVSSFVVFIVGFGAFLAYWSKKAGTVNAHPNLGFIYAFASSDGSISTSVVVLIIIFASVMNESAVDSFQNAITDSLTTFAIALGYKLKPVQVRWIVAFSNIPIMGLAVYFADTKVSILNPLGLVNIVTCFTALPLAAGLVPQLNDYLTSFSALGACFCAFFATVTYAAIAYNSVSVGMGAIFWSSSYDAYGFLTAFVSSVIFMGICICVELLARWYFGWPMPHFEPPQVPSLAINDDRVIYPKPNGHERKGSTNSLPEYPPKKKLEGQMNLKRPSTLPQHPLSAHSLTAMDTSFREVRVRSPNGSSNGSSRVATPIRGNSPQEGRSPQGGRSPIRGQSPRASDTLSRRRSPSTSAIDQRPSRSQRPQVAEPPPASHYLPAQSGHSRSGSARGSAVKLL